MAKATRASRVIAEWLKAGTEQDPHTQELLAERLSAHVGRPLSQSTVSNIARGEQQPRADLVAAFRVELGIEPEWWLPDAPGSAPCIAENANDDAA